MSPNNLCPKCHLPLVEIEGVAKAKLGAIVYEPDGRRLIAPQGERLFTNECYRVGINSLEIRLVSLWGHAAGNEAEFEWHLRRAIRAVKGCQVVMLFGTDVTQVFLSQGISGIIGLEKGSPFLPGVRLFPVPNPTHTVAKPLGEFRLCLQRVSQALAKSAPKPRLKAPAKLPAKPRPKQSPARN